MTSPTAAWRGRVVDPDGSPVPQATVVIVGASVPMPEIALLSDDDGRFALRLPPGVFTLRAHGRQTVGQVRVDTASGDREIVVTLGEPATATESEEP